MNLHVDGHTAYAYTGGKPFDATLPAVVLIHGALNDHSVWTLLARWLAHHGHAVLAPDLPGHGRSAGPPLPSVEALADWALALLDAAGARDAAWVGHSMGSLIALEAAARASCVAPSRARRLVMVGTAYPMKVSAALLQTAREQPAEAIHRVSVLSHATIAAKPGFPGPGWWLHGSGTALMHRLLDQAGALQAVPNAGNLFAHDFGVCDAYAGGEAAARTVTCPVTFILGAADQMTRPEAAAPLAAALRATVVTLPGGHALMSEQPDPLLAAVRRALA